MVVRYTRDDKEYVSAVGTIEYDKELCEIHITFVDEHFGMFGLFVDGVDPDDAEHILKSLSLDKFYDFRRSRFFVEFYDHEDDSEQ